MNSAHEAVPAEGVPLHWHPRPSREAKKPHPDAGEIISPETAKRFGYQKRIGKISNQGQPIYSAHFKSWLWAQQRGRCGYCGDALTPGRGGQIDHIVPRSSGGSNLPPNLMYACGPCNSGKCNRGLDDVRHMIRVRRSKFNGVILPKQVLALEALGVDLGLPKTVVFLCEAEAWSHVELQWFDDHGAFYE